MMRDPKWIGNLAGAIAHALDTAEHPELPDETLRTLIAEHAPPANESEAYDAFMANVMDGILECPWCGDRENVSSTEQQWRRWKGCTIERDDDDPPHVTLTLFHEVGCDDSGDGQVMFCGNCQREWAMPSHEYLEIEYE